LTTNNADQLASQLAHVHVNSMSPRSSAAVQFGTSECCAHADGDANAWSPAGNGAGAIVGLTAIALVGACAGIEVAMSDIVAAVPTARIIDSSRMIPRS
jgi:hypothetical protein